MVNLEKRSITIIGVGNIGFRYLQAVLSLENIFKIFLIEPNINLLKSTLKENDIIIDSNIKIKEKLDKESINVSLIIVSTTSNIRLEIIKSLNLLGAKSPLILEKFLFPDSYSFQMGKDLLNNYPSPIYVNEWMRLTILKDIVKNYENKNVEFNFLGKFGILCNAVHFIDLIKETLQINNLSINENESYCEAIVDSKRSGYKEFKGIISMNNDKYKLRLIDIDDSFDPKVIKLTIKCNKIEEIYFLGEPHIKDIKNKIIGKLPFLSEHSQISINAILSNNKPLIPDFKTAIEHHQLVFDALRILISDDDFKKIKIT